MLSIKKITSTAALSHLTLLPIQTLEIVLLITFLIPEDTGFYIDDVCIPHTWYPIEARNNLVAFKFLDTNWFAYAPAGNYTAVNLGVAIAKAMNAALTIGDCFESTYDASSNKITI